MTLLSCSKRKKETKLIGVGAERGERESQGEKEGNGKVSWERRNTEVKDNAERFVSAW